MKYYKVHMTGRRWFWIQVISESAGFITGWEVDRDGERTHKQHIIQRGAARFVPARVNRTYACMEVIGQRKE